MVAADKIKPFSSIPTAPGRLPLIGNLLTVLATFKRPQLHLPMLEWSRLLGPVYRYELLLLSPSVSSCPFASCLLCALGSPKRGTSFSKLLILEGIKCRFSLPVLPKWKACSEYTS